MSGNCPECEEGLPEWIMSYADMITILMAFFVVMYSMAGDAKDQVKEEAVMRSLRDTFGPMTPGVPTMGAGTFIPLKSPMSRLFVAKANSVKNAGKQLGSSDVKPALAGRVPMLRPREQSISGGLVYFPEAGGKLSEEQQKQLAAVADLIGGKPQKIEVRGHTSRRPPGRDAPYRDNWDLAYSRSRAVMESLVALGVDSRRIRLTVAGDNEPAAGSVDSVTRSRHSRVEIFLLDEVVNLEPDPSARPTSSVR